MAHGPVAAVVVVEVGGVAHLVEALPLLFAVAGGPGVVAEELLLVHEGCRHI